MRDWVRANRQAAILVGLTLAVPLLLVIYLALNLMVTRSDHQAEIERLEPRIARMQGLIDSEKFLAESAEKFDGQLRGLVFPSTDELATVAATLQENVRDIATAAGLTVSNSQILRASQKEGFDQIGLKLTLSGDVTALDAALLEFASYVPLLLVESIEVWPERQLRKKGEAPRQNITANLRLLSLRTAP